MPRKRTVKAKEVTETPQIDERLEETRELPPLEDVLALEADYFSGENPDSQYAQQGYGDFEPWISFFKHVANRLKRQYKPKSAIDAGAALGVLVKYMNAAGIPTKGFDSSEYAVQNAVAPVDLRDLACSCWAEDGAPETAALVTCIEVLEHVPADKAEIAIENLCSLVAPGGTLVFSSVPPEKNTPSPYHVNVQPEAYWLDLFARHGFKKQKDDVRFICGWAIALRK